MKKITLFIISIMLSAHVYAKSEYSSGIFHLGVVVADMDKSIDFYQNVLGMKRVDLYEADEKKATELGLTNELAFEAVVFRAIDVPEATELKLITFDGIESQHPKQHWIHDDVGVQYLTLLVSSIEPFLKRIEERRIPMLGATPVALDETNSFIMIQDPDGNFVELIGPAK